tara:strand:- start:3677 stop:5116 length:1440 start_codon:yes stop_codon:yes gene_type:complete
MSLSLDGIGTLQQQIFRGLRSNIATGQLVAGSRLPPSRVLALELFVSRNTVVAAFEQLCAEGYAETRPGSGTYVADVPTEMVQTKDEAIAPRWSEFSTRLNNVPDHLVHRQPRQRLRYDFLYGEPGYVDLPIEQWARIIGKTARNLTESQLGYAPTGGLSTLREALAQYLQRARGVRCDPDQVMIVQGTQEAIELVTRAFIEPGSLAVIEEPHYRGFERCLRAAGAELLAVPVDESGLQTDALLKVNNARVTYTTPSHQFPAGSVLSLARRVSLLEWAAKHRTVIVEDDYDGEFRYESRPIPSMQSLDQNGCVIYVGTASKVLFPSLRLGWMVLPKRMVSTFQRLKSLSDTNCSTLEQLAFTEFINGGYLERHVHKVRKKHLRRRAVLLDELAKALADQAEVVGTSAGIHILLRLKRMPRDKMSELIEKAAEQNVGIYPASPYYLQQPEWIELLLGYASLSPTQIKTGIRKLASVIRGC